MGHMACASNTTGCNRNKFLDGIHTKAERRKDDVETGTSKYTQKLREYKS